LLRGVHFFSFFCLERFRSRAATAFSAISFKRAALRPTIDLALAKVSSPAVKLWQNDPQLPELFF